MLKWDLKDDTFHYFAYGCNIFSYKMHLDCSTAEFVSIARLDNYRLDFIKYSRFWGGPTSTAVPTANAHIWGVIWKLKGEESTILDEIVGVTTKQFYIKYVDVLTPHIGTFRCRTFIQKVSPLPRGDNDKIPVERWPSWTYREVLICGALEHGLPEYYIEHLKKLKHNGEEAYLRTQRLLIRYAQGQPCECRVPGRIPRKPLKLDLTKTREEKIVKS